tara:strand:- start:353 stop:1102 length:750 start_codon:yes stop_codon:yes gene_type:complete
MYVGNKRVTGFGFILPIFLLLLMIGLCIHVSIPAVYTPRHVARRSICKNNLKQLGLAMHFYYDDHKMFPSPKGDFGNELPPYSWRIALLPYVEESQLFDRYNFSEEWNGPSNASMNSIQLTLFLCPENPLRTGDHPRTETDYVGIIGDETIFSDGHPTKFHDISDGTSNTLMFGELLNSDIHWMEPRDLDFNAISKRINSGGVGISSDHEGGANVAFVDGMVRFLSEDIEPNVLRALMTKSGGETVDEF